MLAYLATARRDLVSNPLISGKNSERGGFEPPVPFGTQPFQDCTIDHSDIFPKNDSTEKNLIHNPGCETVLFLEGKRGIRTPGALRLNGFRDRPIRPLSHLSNKIKHKPLIGSPYETKWIRTTGLQIRNLTLYPAEL